MSLLVSENQKAANTSVPSDDMTLLREAAAFHKAGDKEKARALLVEAAVANPRNELVWLWHASLARTAAEAMTAVGKVLDINPYNQKALDWKVKLESRFPASVSPSHNGHLNGAAHAVETVEQPAETHTATEEYAEEHVEQKAAEQVVEEAATATEEAVAEEIVEQEVAQEAAEEVAEEETVVEAAAEQTETVEAISEYSSAAAEEYVETELQEQPANHGDDDALAALEAESSTESETIKSAADFWSEVETEEETEPVSEDAEVSEESEEQYGDYSATARALEALDQRVDDTKVVEEDDDPIRRLLAERSGTPYQPYSDSDEDSWSSRHSSRDADEQDESSNDNATLLAMLTQDSVAAKSTVDWEETETETESEPEAVAEVETREQPAKSPNTHWECVLCGQQSHRVESSCPACKSVVDLNRLPDMARNEDVDRVSLKRLISEWEERAELEPTAALCTKLALGYLNLRQSNSALPHLLQAARLDRGNEALAAALEQVSRRPLILVVDDSRTVQRMVLSTLEKELFRVQIAEDGLQALAKLNEETPSLILLDITMPRMDGYQVCKVITGNDAFKHIPVVMLSGKDGFFDKVRGRMVGAKDYITKPFEADSLVKSVRKRIETPAK